MEPLYACGTSLYANPDSVFIVTDKSGVFTTDRGSSGVITNENGKIVNKINGWTHCGTVIFGIQISIHCTFVSLIKS